MRRRHSTFIAQVRVERGSAVNYIPASQAARQHSLSRAWVKRLAQQGRLDGAFKVGRTWCVPADWVPPTLTRGRRPKGANDSAPAREFCRIYS